MHRSRLFFIALVALSANPPWLSEAHAEVTGPKNDNGYAKAAKERPSRIAELLHQWLCRVLAVYKAPVNSGNCVPLADLTYLNGHILGLQSTDNCAPAVGRALRDAIEAVRPPSMPPALASQQIPVRF
jgi:hypothetical protein